MNFASAQPAQNPPTDPVRKKPLRVGLVLSGGGARGAAHVGVIKVLEEMRIPVCFISGTSMGAAVGGLYASGMTASQLSAMFEKFDWNSAFSDSPPRRELSFRRKEDDKTFLVKARVGIGKDGVKLPLGLVEGQNFITELRKLSQVTESVDSFDKLPIPFRACATDLVTGKSIVLSQGDLIKSIRASIAITPLFSPAEIDGSLYVDGGYVKNIPVDVAQKMGVERLIVVNIGTPLAKQKDIKSVMDVISQVGRFGGTVSDDKELSMLGSEDVLIEPDLHDLSFIDFGKIPEIIERGAVSTRALKETLSQYALSEEEYRQWRASLPPMSSLPRVDSLQIENGTKISNKVLEPFISQPMGATLDPARMQSDLARLYGLGYFEYIDYHVKAEDGKNILVIEAPRKSWGPDYLKLGFKMAENFKGNGDYGIMARYQMTEINSLGAEFAVDGTVGLNSGASAEFFQPVGKVPRWLSYGAPYFLFAKAYVQQDNEPILIDKNIEFPFRMNNYGALVGGGRSLGNWGQFRASMGWMDEMYRTPTIPDFDVSFKQVEVAATLSLDTLDSAGFPRKGLLGEAQLRGTNPTLGAVAPASMGLVKAGGAFSFDRHTVRLKGELASNFAPASENEYLQRLGGFLNLSGYSQNSLVGTEKALTQAQYLYQLGHVVGMPFYSGVAGEWGGTWTNIRPASLASGVFAGSVFLALDTGLGPAYFAFSKAENDVQSFYLYVGQSF